VTECGGKLVTKGGSEDLRRCGQRLGRRGTCPARGKPAVAVERDGWVSERVPDHRLERADHRELRGHSPQEVSFLFYFSGHGDHEALHLTGEVFPIRELQERLARLPAALRLVVIDACRTKTDRAKGMTTEPGFPIALSSAQIASGVAWLFASSDGDVAQESDEIGGALFSHFWTTGLRGAADSNGDGRVTLQESFDFAYAQTLLRSARSGAALQRPQETLELTEAGPVVLTALPTWHRDRTRLLPASLERARGLAAERLLDYV
jgi:hypothetical protein